MIQAKAASNTQVSLAMSSCKIKYPNGKTTTGGSTGEIILGSADDDETAKLSICREAYIKTVDKIIKSANDCNSAEVLGAISTGSAQRKSAELQKGACKAGFNLAKGSEQSSGGGTGAAPRENKPKNYEEADASLKDAARATCEDVKLPDGSTLSTRDLQDCMEGFVLGAVNNGDPCDGDRISNKIACWAGYASGQSGKEPGTLRDNAITHGGRLMEEFETKCSDNQKFTANANRCKEIYVALMPICGRPVTRDDTVLEQYISSCNASLQTTGAITTTDDGSGGEVGTNCSGGPMGWLFCPMIEAMAKVVQESAKLIDSLMTVRFLTSDDSANTIETAWRAILSVANLLLVVAFLIIIFSQATSAGLSNYNVKRMLPRLVVAAILMNLSFYICAFAIDISNIIGGSIMGFLLGSGNSIASSITEVTGGEGGADFLSIGGIATGIALIALLFFIFIPVVLSIITVFITLIARQVILMCLVLVSPLAFVAWLLPNTEKYFKKWSDMFIQLLVLYPIVMFIFGVSLYVSKLLGSDTSIIGGDS